MKKKKEKQLTPEQIEKRRLRDKRRDERKKKLEASGDSMICYLDRVYHVWCPLCGCRFCGSDYLKTIFTDERALWLANMVMHYRHNHITSWNKCWGYYGWAYRNAAYFGDYDEEKRKVNERAKRQIARKATDYIYKNNVNVEVFDALQGTTEETRNVVKKLLDKYSKN